MNLNKKRLVVISCICMIIIIFMNIYLNGSIKVVSVSDSNKFVNEYESLNNEITSDNVKYPKVSISNSNKIKYVSVDKVLEILKNGTALIYIGYAKCLYCRSVVEVLIHEVNNSDLEYLYYLDISKDMDSDKYSELLLNLGNDYLDDDLYKKNKSIVSIGDKNIRVPLVLFVVDGEIVSSNIGTVFSQDDPYEKLNKDQIEGLSEIYKYGINDVVNKKK